MLRLDHALLDSSDIGEGGAFRATTSAHGLYNTFHFVLRLSPEVHRRLAKLSSDGITDGATLDFETVQAVSAYRNLTMRPNMASGVINAPLFESVGHAFEIAVGNSVMLLGTTIDPEFKVKCPHLATAIQEYSRAEYEAVSTELAMALVEYPPLVISELVAKWPQRSTAIKSLMNEHATFDFFPGNIVPRFMLAHFIAFQEDKLKTPEFFVWPGAWMTGPRAKPEIVALDQRHAAPFIDKPDDDGVFPRIYADRDQDNVQKTFDMFYGSVVLYDMVHQWITEPGPFKYRYRWLSQAGPDSELKAFVDRGFKSAFGVHPDDVELLV